MPNMKSKIVIGLCMAIVGLGSCSRKDAQSSKYMTKLTVFKPYYLCKTLGINLFKGNLTAFSRYLILKFATKVVIYLR